LENPTKKIIEQLQERIEKGEYGIIVGDDASGRVPTLILGGFLKRIYEVKKIPLPKIIFIPGGQKQTPVFVEQLRRHLENFGFTGQSRVLIVTEFIATGYTLGTLSRGLKTLGFEFDIATIGLFEEQNEKMRGELGIDTLVVSGEYERVSGGTLNFTPLIYKDKFMTGVKKVWKEKRPHSVPVKLQNFFGGTTPEQKKSVQNKINQARKDTGVLVDKLVKWYLSKK